MASVTTASQRVIDALRSRGYTVREGSPTTMAQCPAHDDSTPSLAIRGRTDGRGVVIHCHADCDYRDVLAKLGLRDIDLFDDTDIRSALNPNGSYRYPSGREKVRKPTADGGKTFFWIGTGTDDSLYAADRLGDAKVAYLCEGEKAVDLLRALGHAAVATGSASRTDCDLTPLKGRHVLMVVDRDGPGMEWAVKCATRLRGMAASVSAMRTPLQIEHADVVEHIAAGLRLDQMEPVTLPSMNGHHPEHAEPAPVRIRDLEADFWEREPLRIVYDAALSRMCSPWAVLAHVISRVLNRVRPGIVLPPIIGGVGSLNWFGAVCAPSGGGKGSASAAARDLVPDEYLVTRNLGSGEGICAQFYKPGTKDTPPTIREAVMFEAAEIDMLTSLSNRSGQTTMSILRCGFSGETLGFSYRNNDHHVLAHDYRMTLVLSLQPARARPLIDDSGGGSPQRFQWFPGLDNRVRADPPWWPGELLVRDRGDLRYPRVLAIPDEARDTIIAARVNHMNGDSDALDGHSLFVREKCAYALALIDNRIEMNLADWELSGIAMAVSDHVRREVVDQLEQIGEDEAAAHGRMLGVSQAASNAARDIHRAKQVRKASDWVLRKLKEGPRTNRELSRGINSRIRDWLPDALDKLVQDHLIGRDMEGRWVLL